MKLGSSTFLPASFFDSFICLSFSSSGLQHFGGGGFLGGGGGGVGGWGGGGGGVWSKRFYLLP